MLRYLTLLSIVLIACRTDGKRLQRINGAGSTFVYPLISKWSYEYYKLNRIQINYQSIGSGGGIKQVEARTVDFGATDAPLTPKELEEKELLQYPIIIGGVVPVVNLDLEAKLKLSSKVICDIFLGRIRKWNDEEIAKLNPDIKLPDMEIVVVHRADGSGTTWIWTNYLSKACPEWKERIGYGKSVKWPVGIGAKGNEGVSNYVKQTKGAIGYVEYAYAIQNKLSFAMLESASGKFVEPNIESFMEAAKHASWNPENHFYTILTYTEGKAWPATGATWILLPKESTDKNKIVNAFFKWAFEQGDEYALKLHYVPLPQDVKRMVYSYWREHNVSP